MVFLAPFSLPTSFLSFGFNCIPKDSLKMDSFLGSDQLFCKSLFFSMSVVIASDSWVVSGRFIFLISLFDLFSQRSSFALEYTWISNSI